MNRISIVAAGLVASVALSTVPAGAQTPSTQEFVNKVAISDMFEVQASQIALAKQADADTKPFAEKMVTDHQKTSSELKALIDGGKVKAKLPTALDSEHQKLLDDLKAKSGKDFDQSYDQAQVKGHKDAVYGVAIQRAVARSFGQRGRPALAVEPGRSLVADAGVLVASVPNQPPW